MASVELTISHDDNFIGKKSKVLAEIEKFKSKWSKEVSLFEDSLFLEDDEEGIWLLTTPGNEIEVSTSDYGRLEEGPNISKAIFKLFSFTTKSVGDCDFEFGETPFEIDFYLDLLKLTLFEQDTAGFRLGANVIVSTESGYYSGNYEFYGDESVSAVATFTYYDEDEDDEWF